MSAYNELFEDPAQDSQKQPVSPAGSLPAPVVPVVTKPFMADGAELVFSLLSYIAAYLYVSLFFNDLGRFSQDTEPLWRVLPIALFAVLAGLVLNRKKKAPAESWFWLVCLLILVFSLTFRFYGVWNQGQLFLLVHAFMVWWILSRSGLFLEQKSSRYLPMDGINGLFVIPFLHYFLRIRSIVKGLSLRLQRGKGKGRNLVWIIGAVLLSLLLFSAAAHLLMQADSHFASSLRDVFDSLRLNEETLFYFVFSLPVGAYIYGLIGGSARMENDLIYRQKNAINHFLSVIRRVPASVWSIVIFLFSVLYIAFFALQTGYFLGAFTHTLPEGFIVSQYAREGFFELCRVLAINFALLWLVTRMSERDVKSSLLLKISCLLLLLESLLFAVIAGSKILLYVSNFGWTPLRIQSLWLVGVLALACLFWAVNLLSEKKPFRLWFMLSAGSLCLLSFL